jgi:hypothetical protein
MSDEAEIEALRVLMDDFAPENLHAELIPYIEKSSFGHSLRHPLVYSVPYFEQSNKHLNKFFAHKKERLERSITDHDWNSFVFLHERPYRVDALEEVMFRYEVEDPNIIWPLVRSVWIDSENIHQNFDRWRDIWENGPPRRSIKCMEATERHALNALPKEFKVYRGVAHVEASRGMSWTTNREKALWFARRFEADKNRTPLLITANVHRSDVIAYYLGRGENEIVIMPEHVEILTIDDAKKIS